MCSDAKRMKMDDTVSIKRIWRLKPVLSDDVSADVPLVNAWVDKIKNKKYISGIISHLNKLCPVPGLQHLKRVRGNEMLITIADAQLKDLLENFMTIEVFTLGLSLDPYLMEVPSTPPRTKTQFASCNRVWPCNFHPDKILEDKLSGKEFSEEHLHRIESWMRKCLEICNQAGVGCVVVDAGTNQLIASGVDDRLGHPMKHAAMVAIDNVAKEQGGGAWNGKSTEMGSNRSDSSQTVAMKSTLSLPLGQVQDVPSVLRDVARKEPDDRLGDVRTMTSEQVIPIGQVVTKAAAQRDSNENNSDDRLDGPYLCTGYDVFLTAEPCLMCAMALVHSRAKRIFYGCPNLCAGALSSRLKLHTVANLNHHYEVYAGVLEEECEAAFAMMKQGLAL